MTPTTTIMTGPVEGKKHKQKGEVWEKEEMREVENHRLKSQKNLTTGLVDEGYGD